MFVRILRMKLKRESGKGIARAVDQDIVPILKKSVGFAGEFTLVSSDGKEALGVTLWESREDVETYNREGAASVLKVLANYTEGKSESQTYDLTHSTLETLPVRKAA
jgi:hypothetical protein